MAFHRDQYQVGGAFVFMPNDNEHWYITKRSRAGLWLNRHKTPPFSNPHNAPPIWEWRVVDSLGSEWFYVARCAEALRLPEGM